MTRKEAIDGIVAAFNLTTERQDGKSFYVPKDDDCASFFFDKREITRDEVVNTLVRMFEHENIIDGQCRINAFTFVWTTVLIEKR